MNNQRANQIFLFFFFIIQTKLANTILEVKNIYMFAMLISCQKCPEWNSALGVLEAQWL